MDILDILGSLKAEDSPIFTVPEHNKLISYLSKQKNDVTFKDIEKNTNIKNERLLEINQEISLHWKDKLVSKVLYKSMIKSGKDESEEFKQFFQRPDVDIACLFMFKIKDIKENMRNLNTPQYLFIKDNWEKYRGY